MNTLPAPPGQSVARPRITPSSVPTGAGLANATVAFGGTREALRSFTIDAGDDGVSFDGTKNGVLSAEAVVFLNPEAAVATDLHALVSMIDGVEVAKPQVNSLFPILPPSVIEPLRHW